MHRTKRPYRLPELLTCDPAEIENGISMELIEKYVKKHERFFPRYNYLENLYKGFHDVYKEPEKEDWKPDSRLAVNFPRFITETFLGYAYGIPIKETHPDEGINESIKTFRDNNEITDHESELIKACCIYGHAFEYIYQDEETQTKMTVCTPIEMFVVYDDTMKKRGLFAVRYGYHITESGTRGEMYGEILSKGVIEPFDKGKKLEPYDNPYGYIPCVEWRLNDERMGLYESAAGMIEAYNHTIGEKANDVDAFAEAYLAVMGAELDDDGVKRIRDNRLINLYGTDNAKDVLVQFLQKPTADGTQENLLNRLENLIYTVSMVTNINDEVFGSSSSGIALAYKLLPMSNLAKTADRKIEKALKKRYKIFCSLQTNVPNKDAWKEIQITTTRNIPRNIQEEVQTASNAEGLVSRETQLSLLSFLDDPKEELEKIKAEEEQEKESVVDRRMFGGNPETDEEAEVNENAEADNE